jgi:NADPH:quinone reductase-like Zn-dependent oxidoreductase
MAISTPAVRAKTDDLSDPIRAVLCRSGYSPEQKPRLWQSYMRVFAITDHFGLDQLVLSERPVPQPGPGQVLVRLTAATLNYRDLLVVEGTYNPRLRLPVIPVSDGAGVIEAVGAGATRFRPGDRVVSVFFQGWSEGEPTAEKLSTGLGANRDGVLCEYRLFDESGLLPIPDYLTDAEAAALPCAGVTAWSAMTRLGSVKPGDTVLVQGTGGVALFALQFAKLAGATVILTSSSDAKLARGKELGADHLINYRAEPNWSRPVKDLTDGRGADLVIEIGGAGTLERSIRAVRVGGTIAMIGVVAGAAASDVPLPLVVMREVRMQGVTLGSRADFEAMLRACTRARLHPVLDDRRSAFDEVPAAFARMKAGEHFGKIVIEF